MRVIHKFGPYNPCEIINIEGVRKVVHFDQQGNQLYIWAEVDKEDKTNTNLAFLIVPTGADYEPEWIHVASVVDSTQLVWHLLKEPRIGELLDRVFGGGVF